MIPRAGHAVPLDQPRLSRLRRFPRRVLARQAQEGEAGAAQAARGRRHVRAQDAAPRSRPADWAFFYHATSRTYRAHHSTPYLTPAFFEGSGDAARATLLLVIGMREGRRLCAALDIYTPDTLWGRYWGMTRVRAGAALRGVLLPGDRVLHRARASRASKAARRACTSSRAACGPSPRIRCTPSATPTSPTAIADFCARERVDVEHSLDELAIVLAVQAGPGSALIAAARSAASTTPITSCCRCRRGTAFRCASTRVCASAWPRSRRIAARARRRRPTPSSRACTIPATCGGHAAGTLDAQAQRRIGFPWSPAMVERSRRSAGATLAACRSALASGCGVNLAGRHASRASRFGEGFCVFNDAAVAARAMQAEGRVARVADRRPRRPPGRRHRASIFAGDDSVFTLLDARPRQFSVSQERVAISTSSSTTAPATPRYLAALAHRAAARARRARGPTSRSTSRAPTRSKAIASAGWR